MATGKKNYPPLTKAAAIIVAMGSAQAAEVYKHLAEDEVERLTIEVGRTNNITALRCG